ncbi:MAG: 4-alpha-glucanotransferase, partial [Xanthobacteraceae bacterium]|nr:4-alpha-glucanotransferase [Xanthobacteraceae bacterium]
MKAAQEVRDLARDVGIAVDWINAAKEPRRVSDDNLIRILGALGFACETDAQLAASRERMAALTDRSARASFMTAEAGEPIRVPGEHASTGLLALENGETRDIRLEPSANGLCLPGIAQPGYHEVHLRDRSITIAVAPRRCVTPADLAGRPRSWGVAVQLYGLRERGDFGIGNASGLVAFAEAAARAGADAVALSPTHAMFTADPRRYGPYSPSSRLFLNPLHADPAIVLGRSHVDAVASKLGLPQRMKFLESRPLIDWAESSAGKLALFHAIFEGVWEDLAKGELAQTFASFRARGGTLLENHARFEAIQAFQLDEDPGRWNWRSWPAPWRNPD